MSTTYMAECADGFYNSMIEVSAKIKGMLGDTTSRREFVSNSIKELQRKSEDGKNKLGNGNSQIDKMLLKAAGDINLAIAAWENKIEIFEKGNKFMKKHQDYLVLLVFGAVNSGKSSLGNFIGGREFGEANFSNVYKKNAPPKFEKEDSRRSDGGIITTNGKTWFQEGVTDTTGAIQYYTLGGMRWMDSPGTGAMALQGDTGSMEDLVNEYLPYADVCIFLMNSSEPGLQKDMKYISKLSNQGQESLVVITKSDLFEEDVDDDGNIIEEIVPKSNETRALQENDILSRLKDEYPDINTNMYKAVSVSVKLAADAIKEENDDKFRGSNIDKLMQAITDKINRLDGATKQNLAKKAVNILINTILLGDKEASIMSIDELNSLLKEPLKGIEAYQKKIDERTRSITKQIINSIERQLRDELHNMSGECERSGKSVSSSDINNLISSLTNSPATVAILNKEIGKIIDNYQEQSLSPMQATISSGGIKKEIKEIEHTVEVTNWVSRDPSGFFEHVQSFFGKTFGSNQTTTKVVTQKIDMGTNIDNVIDEVIPQVEANIEKYVRGELENIKKNYFDKQQKYINAMSNELVEMKKLLEKNKYSDVKV